MDDDDIALIEYTIANRKPIAEAGRAATAEKLWLLFTLIVMGLFGLWAFSIPLILLYTFLVGGMQK
jgi:hypothetical protein